MNSIEPIEKVRQASRVSAAQTSNASRALHEALRSDDSNALGRLRSSHLELVRALRRRSQVHTRWMKVGELITVRDADDGRALQSLR